MTLAANPQHAGTQLCAAATDEGNPNLTFPENSSTGRGCWTMLMILYYCYGWRSRSESEVGEELMSVLPAAKSNCVVTEMMIDCELC